MHYECDKCGACCRYLIVEIDHLDVVREPVLLGTSRLLDGNGKIEYESDWEKQYGLACGSNHPCPHLNEGNLCQIYHTRPNSCVAFEAGSEQCQEAREMANLLPLEPITEKVEEERKPVAFNLAAHVVYTAVVQTGSPPLPKVLANRMIELFQEYYEAALMTPPPTKG